MTGWPPTSSLLPYTSLFGAPLALAGLLQMPDAGLQAPAVWHWSAAVQATGLVLLMIRRPPVSALVPYSPLFRAAPLALAGLLQMPDAGLQAPAVWHWSAAVQATGLVLLMIRRPPVSALVPYSPLFRAAPLALAGLLQMPDAGLQAPAVWHWSAAVQATGLVLLMIRRPPVSALVPYSPLFRAAPLALAGLLQMPDAGLQAPAVWHWSAAVQAAGLAPAQAPPSQVSGWVPAVPSLQGAPLALAGLVQKARAGVPGPAGGAWAAAG